MRIWKEEEHLGELRMVSFADNRPRSSSQDKYTELRVVPSPLYQEVMTEKKHSEALTCPLEKKLGICFMLFARITETFWYPPFTLSGESTGKAA